MVLGHLKFRQYIRNIGHIFGIKLYTLTELDGLVIKFQVYTNRQDREEIGRGHSEVVMQLLKEKLTHGHSVYIIRLIIVSSYVSYYLTVIHIAQENCAKT